MPIVRPFVGLLYAPEVAGPLASLTAPPYDVISPADQARYYQVSPYNIARVILGKDEPNDDEGDNKYSRAAASLRAWREQGVLRPTPEPCVYPYELRFRLGGRWRRVRGVVAEVELEPWGGSIVPHERTIPGPMDDRLRLLRSVRTNLSPVYGVFAGPSPPLAAFLDEAMASRPHREAIDEAGTGHRLWVCPQGWEALVGALANDPLLIADGHHRYTVALAYREEMRSRLGPGPWDGMMMLVVDAVTEDPPVLPIHRVLLEGPVPPAPEGERVRDMAELLASLRDEDVTFGMVSNEDGESVHRVASLTGPPPTVCALHTQVLDPAGASPANLRFVPDSVVAEWAVLSGEACVAYLLPPTRVERVWDVVRSGRRLPEKSTYFWPKPRTGMVIRPLTP